jgi:hypothetical protein
MYQRDIQCVLEQPSMGTGELNWGRKQTSRYSFVYSVHVQLG